MVNVEEELPEKKESQLVGRILYVSLMAAALMSNCCEFQFSDVPADFETMFALLVTLYMMQL